MVLSEASATIGQIAVKFGVSMLTRHTNIPNIVNNIPSKHQHVIIAIVRRSKCTYTTVSSDKAAQDKL